jgi:hypothetical protein
MISTVGITGTSLSGRYCPARSRGQGDAAGQVLLAEDAEPADLRVPV